VDRHYGSALRSLDLTREDPKYDFTGEQRRYIRPRGLYLRQHVRESEPAVVLCLNDEPERWLTMDEAVLLVA
jgi:hypothetical protein